MLGSRRIALISMSKTESLWMPQLIPLLLNTLIPYSWCLLVLFPKQSFIGYIPKIQTTDTLMSEVRWMKLFTEKRHDRT